jgi:predicted transposase YdaD
MQTDIPLKRLTLLRPADLLPLLGITAAQVLAVESLELPASATRLDNVLRLRSAHGQEYLHVVEWQGYHDPSMLWRFVGYLAWLGQRQPNTAIAGTLIYLTPADDTGNTLRQQVDEQVVLDWHIPCVRLWEEDAPAALASGNLGLTVLSPLMRNATEALVEQAVATLSNEAALPQQADLLSILGVFAEPLMKRERYVRLVGREKLMASDLLTYLMEEKLAEVRAEKDAEKEAALEAAREAAREAAHEAAHEAAKNAAIDQLQQTLEEVVIARFPDAPIALVHDIQRITDPRQLQQLIVAVIRAADLPDFERSLAQAAASAL